DVQDLACDFYTFSGHKLYGPSGIGALYGRLDLLTSLPPWQGGGSMIEEVTFERTTYAPPPARYEAGTPNIAGAVGLAAAIDYVQRFGSENIQRHEAAVLKYGVDSLQAFDGVRLIGTPRHRAGSISFVVDGVHPHDVGTVLDQEGVAVRVGHHCAQPAMRHFDVPATIRASLGIYTHASDFDALVQGLGKVRELFQL
ncbi:MAG: aminotransferase class V-fold PLP-dependent enzyme, partial [Gammaproteobacteria bacterium]|nr:aminotransferase class V-fold PLP-dependent enzyme [Gammaproteobacteria bacterium]